MKISYMVIDMKLLWVLDSNHFVSIVWLSCFGGHRFLDKVSCFPSSCLLLGEFLLESGSVTEFFSDRNNHAVVQVAVQHACIHPSKRKILHRRYSYCLTPVLRPKRLDQKIRARSKNLNTNLEERTKENFQEQYRQLHMECFDLGRVGINA